MNASIQLRWQTNVLASCLHAAHALLQQQTLADPALAAALLPPAECLQQAIMDEHLPPKVFWSHLLPLSAVNGNLEDVARVTLRKIVGPGEGSSRVIHFRQLLHDIRFACTKTVPQFSDATSWSMEPLRQQWNMHGIGLLSRIMLWTEPEVLVEEATVIGVYPVCGGGGGAHLPYNLARLEAVTDAGPRTLPEVLRLAWLLSMLNLDVPYYAEQVRTGRLAQVAALAMLPVALTAAADLHMIHSADETLEPALQSWLPAEVERIVPLRQWWETYRTMRPPWNAALKGLDSLLD